MRFWVALVFSLIPAAAQAATPLDALLAQLRQASSPEEAKPIEQQVLAQFALSGSPSVDLLMTRAASAENAGDKDTARKLYDAITRISPGFAEAWHRKGLMQSDAGDDEGAMVSLQKAVALNPKNFEALEQLAEMLEDYGDKQGALKLYRQAQALDPQIEGLQRHIDSLTRDVEGQGI